MNLFSYPKLYRAPLFLQLLVVSIGIVACFGSAVLISLANNGAVELLPFGLLFLVIGVLLPIIVLTSKLVLFEDKIKQSNLFTSRELSLHELQGYRRRVVKNATMIDLLPLRPEQKKITVTRQFAEDAQFVNWLQSIPNLDQIDELVVAQEIESDPSLGATPAERSARIKRWRRRLTIAIYVYLAMSIGIFFTPIQRSIVVAYLLSGPWICIGLLAYSKHFTLIELDKASLLKKLNLQPLLMFSAASFCVLLIGIRPGILVFPIDWQKPLLMALMGSFLMTLLVLRLSRGAKLTWTGLFAIVPPFVVYVGGALILINTEFDARASMTYRLTVVGKHLTTGRPVVNYLEVSSPRADYRGESAFKVSAEMYGKTHIGEHVCASIHPGALSMPWGNLVPCSIEQ